MINRLIKLFTKTKKQRIVREVEHFLWDEYYYN